MTAALAAILVASLLGSAHCAGMCGGFVCFYAGSDARASGSSHVAYHGGRLLSYLMLGAIAGWAGTGLERAGALHGVGNAAAVAAGALMVGWGVITLLGQRAARLASVRVPALLARPLRAVHGRPPVERAAAMGLLTTLLPCGWLWAFVIGAAGTGRVDHAMLAMAAFWLGTVPALLAVGAGMQRLAGPFRARLPQVSAATVVFLGLLSLAGHLRPMGGMATHAAHAAPTAPSAPAASAPHAH